MGNGAVFVFVLCWLLVLSSSTIYAQNLCMSCQEVQSPELCTSLTKCNANESCYLDAVVTTAGEVRYNQGCRNTAQCPYIQSLAAVGKRSAYIPVCRECCSGTACNSRGCGKPGIPTDSQRGPLCYNCSQQAGQNNCTQVAVCDKTEICMLAQVYSSVSQGYLYQTKCESSAVCDAQYRAVSNFGRKRYNNFVSIGDECKIQCCDTDLCNIGCRPSNQSYATTNLSTPAMVHVANITVRGPTPGYNTTTAISVNATFKTTTVSSNVTADPCSSSPCLMGTCSIYLDTYKCSCQPGYHGRNCEIGHGNNPCLQHPCVHGTCKSLLLGYACLCYDGYIGKNCETKFIQCSDSPCLHGNCTDSPTGYTCQCPQGYLGKNCETEIDNCISNPCYNGVCVNRPDGYSCNCSTGYEGKQCDQVTDFCASQPCQHGNCSQSLRNYTCTCDTGYEGRNCDTRINHCYPNHCRQGKCVNLLTGYRCDCYTGYTGMRCETEIDYCASSPCGEHGRCSNVKSGYSCFCYNGYRGDNCEEVIHCRTGTCVHGTCHNTVTGYHCECIRGFSGSRCGTWSSWSEWGLCAGGCGFGRALRTRTCSTPSSLDTGSLCHGNATDFKTCTLDPCPADGAWGAWLPWTACSATCDIGSVTRHRVCDNPEPRLGGKTCEGSATEFKACFQKGCSDAVWSYWTQWSTCSHGYKTRQRTCNHTESAQFGNPCVGNDMEERKCGPVAFSVNTPGGDKNGVAFFRNVLFNIGSGFSSTTGMFTCPVTGLYIFTVTLYANGQANVNCNLIANNGYVGHTGHYDSQFSDSTVSTTIYLELTVGDKVYAECNNFDQAYTSSTAFSGVLL